MDESRPAERFTLYGVTLESSFRFRSHLKRSTATPDLHFVYHGVTDPDAPPGTELYASEMLGQSGEPVMKLYAGDARETIVYPGIARFDVGRSTIHGFAYAPGIEYLVEICLMGMVAAYWLERHGVPALHASAVALGGRAACFIAGTSRGKTTTAVAMLAAGYPLLCDDIVAIRCADGQPAAQPAFPQMKLLPRQLAHLGASDRGYEKIHPAFEKLMVPIGEDVARYHDEAIPVGGVFLLDRVEDATGSPALVPVSEGEALMELVRHSFAAELADAVDRGPERLARLAGIASAVPFYRLRIPAGYERLSEVPAIVAAAVHEGRGGT